MGNRLPKKSKNYITGWKHNVPKAPCMKGILECMSRSMKRCLKKFLRQVLDFYQEFFSTLIETATLLDTRL